MCGIAGVVGLGSDGRSFPDSLETVVARMSASIAHRGPDGAGQWKSPSAPVVLSHRRLAIIDLSESGRQPMSYAQGRFWITFNGEIYNFRELRAELRALGHDFHSESDTEVLLAAFAEWGIDGGLSRAVGMFALAVWDERKRLLHLARDRMGEKPLYIAEISRHLFFASELRSFRAVPGFEPRISSNAVAGYLRDGCVPGALSIYDGLYKLPPGQVVSIAMGSGQKLTRSWAGLQDVHVPNEIMPRRYWNCPQAVGEATKTRISDAKAAVDQGEELLKHSVRLQMQADVPTGAFLSGGIDSSLVVALMQSQSGQPVRTFTVAFDDPRYDESRYARAIASHLGTRHEEFFLSEKEIVQQVPALIGLMDEPTANGSFFPVYLISRLARSQVTVALSGDGGDELFAGYNRYRLAMKTWRASRWVPAPFRAWAANIISAPGSPVEGRLLGKVAGLGSQVASSEARAKLSRVLRSRTFQESYLRITSCWGDQSILTEPQDVPPRYWSAQFADELSCMLLADQLDYLPDDNLAKLDRASMAVSLETRLPLLDHRIVEFSWRLASDSKLRGGTTKWLLRAILDRYLPRSLVERPKMGFSVPTAAWLRGPLRDWASDILRTAAFRSMSCLRHEAVLGLWGDFLSGSGPSAYQMWSLVMLAAWAHKAASDKPSSRI